MPHPTARTLQIPHEVPLPRRLYGGMSKASSRAEAGADSFIERWQHWIAALASALLHLLFVLLALWTSPVAMTPPQGTAAGSRVAVDFIGETPPPISVVTPKKPVVTPPPASRVQSTRAPRADNPVPPNFVDDAAQGQEQAPAATAPPTPPMPTTPPRRSRTWGQPPGMMQEDLASENVGLARSSSTQSGRRNDAASGQPSMEVGGYQVYYDLRSENRLRTWREQGMTEVFLPLPGTRRYMACPLETALKRESGPCRLIEPDSPELANIGDAREAINMQKVYKQGDVVWSGPGAYR